MKKLCPKCQTIKSLTKFYKKGQKIKSYWCKACCKIKDKIWFKTHPNYCKIKKRIYFENEINKSHYKINQKSWRKTHPSYQRSWRKTHPGYFNAAKAQYLVNRDQRTPPWANLEMIKEFYIKAARLTEKTGIQHDVDHIIPLHGKNVSGFHVENNLQVITHVKNVRKNNSWP